MKFNPKLLVQISLLNMHKIVRDHTSIIMPPDEVRGMRALDRDMFKKQLDVPILQIPASKLAPLIKHLKPMMLKMEHLRPLRNPKDSAVAQNNMREILLRPDLVLDWNNLPIEKLKECDINESCFKYEALDITYHNWGISDILRSIFPEDVEGLSSFSIIGHVVHVNLRSHLLPFKQLIGEVLLDKVPNCRTVVNKTATIENVYRNFEFERLAGDPEYVVETKENGYIFIFDFSKVYWNPRLSSEHERIYNDLKPNDIVYDVFAGVGPFAVPAACKGCIVFANDINPESIRWLNHNVIRNRVRKELMHTFNMDGREFIKQIVKQDLISRLKQQNSSATNEIYVIMNLPALAVTFLDAFRGLFESELHEINFDNPELRYPYIYCYTFAKGNDENSISDIKFEVEQSLGTSVENILVDIKFVRNVAPNKNMFRVLLRLNKDILTTTHVNNLVEADTVPEITKELKIENKAEPQKGEAIEDSSNALRKRVVNVELQNEIHSSPKKQCGV